MAFRVIVADLDTADGTVLSVPPGRLMALDGEGGTVSFNNRGNTLAAGDRLPPEEEFVEGRCHFYGSPGSTARAWIRFE